MDKETVALVVPGVVWIIALVANIEALCMVEQPNGALRAAAMTFGSIGLVLVVLLPFTILIGVPLLFSEWSEVATVVLVGTVFGAGVGSIGSITTLVLADVADLAGRRRRRHP